MKVISVVFFYIISSISLFCHDNKNPQLNENHITNISFLSSKYEKRFEEENTENERYIIYDDDENSSFSNATLILPNTEYDFCFNDRGDIDYFKCYLGASDIISIDCDIYYDIDIYKYNGTTYKHYLEEAYSSEELIAIDSNTYYFFKVRGPGNYTGFYNFKIITYSRASFCNNDNYVRVKYNDGEIYSAKIISFSDFNNLPSANTKSGFLGNYNSNPFPVDFTGGTLLRIFASNNGLNYINGDGNGIYNSNNIHTGNPLDDNRRIFPYLSYLGSAVTFTINDFEFGSLEERGTAFFVDDEYALTSAHMCYERSSFNFSTSISTITSKHIANFYYVYTLDCLEFILPYAFIYYSVNDPYNPNRIIYDWSILNIDISTIPNNYTHSYLGISYPANDQLTYTNVGYPGYSYEYGSSSSSGDAELLMYILLAGGQGTIINNNNLIYSYIDATSGHSGGPCLYESNNVGVAVGILSGSTFNDSGNIFTPINKYNFALLEKCLTGGLIWKINILL